MSYNFYSDIENWSKAKAEWDKANQAGDEQGKYNAHAKAQVYGDNLRKNGYGNIADEFTNSNYQQSLELLKKYESQKPKNYNYNPEGDVANIYQSKGLWNNANQAGDQQGANLVAAKAQAYYDNLKKNGYGSIADELASSNYDEAKTINDKWSKMGKTATRDYVNTLGQKYGLSSDDMNKIITWDNGEVLIGGKKVGTPDAVIDGVSYWSEDNLPLLDKAFNDYISRTGTYRSKATAVNQENEDLFAKYRGAYDYAMNTNPFTTEEAKAIIGKYDLAGLNARDNAVASGGASNGGNIDSYAAANAMRQQASLVNQGQTVALDAHNAKITNIRNILSDMGVNIDRVFNQDETTKAREFYESDTVDRREYDQMDKDRTFDLNKDKWEFEKEDTVDRREFEQEDTVIKRDFDHADREDTREHNQSEDIAKRTYYEKDTDDRREFEQDETAKNNQTARLLEQAATTGKVPVEWYLKNDTFLSGFVDENGKLKKEYKNTDFQSLVNYAKAQGNKELADKYAILRGLKLSQYFDEFGHFAAEGDVAFIEPGETADVYMTKYQTDSAERMAKDTNATNTQINKQDNETKIKQAEIDNSTLAAISQIEANTQKYNTDAASKLQTYIADKEAATKKYESDLANKKLTDEQLENYKTTIQAVTELNGLLSSFGEGNTGPKNFVLEKLVPAYQSAADTFGLVGEEIVKNTIVNYCNSYNVDKEEAKKICEALKVDTRWLDQYEDCTANDIIVDKNGVTLAKGEYYGMKLKGYVWDKETQGFVKPKK